MTNAVGITAFHTSAPHDEFSSGERWIRLYLQWIGMEPADQDDPPDASSDLFVASYLAYMDARQEVAVASRQVPLQQEEEEVDSEAESIPIADPVLLAVQATTRGNPRQAAATY